MLEITVSLDGAREALERLRAAQDAIPTALQRAVAQAADEARDHLAGASPVRTGRLRASWRVEPGAAGAEVLTEVEYAGYQITGTWAQRVPTPYSVARRGMAPSTTLRAAWLDAPADVAASLERHALEALGL